jgi:hypothetical protein
MILNSGVEMDTMKLKQSWKLKEKSSNQSVNVAAGYHCNGYG